MRKLWRISQQDNYDGSINNCNEFILDLYLHFGSCRFFYIVHDKETDKHIHLLLILENGTTKKELLKYFPKADIRTSNSSNQANYDYLTHKNNKDKIKYNECDIVRNNIDDEFFNVWIKEDNSSSNSCDEIDILNSIVDDILRGEISCYFDILQRYKGVALKYSRSIRDTLAMFNIN